MKLIKIFSIISLFVLLSSCKTDSVEDYFVKASESADFFVVNIPTSIVHFDKHKLDKETLKQIESVKKINILLYDNDIEKSKKIEEYHKAKNAINNKNYKTLTRIKENDYQLSFSYLGTADAIDEVVFLGKNKDFDFVIGKIKGNHINAKSIVKAFKHIKSVDKNQAKSVLDIFNFDNE